MTVVGGRGGGPPRGGLSQMPNSDNNRPGGNHQEMTPPPPPPPPQFDLEATAFPPLPGMEINRSRLVSMHSLQFFSVFLNLVE